MMVMDNKTVPRHDQSETAIGLPISPGVVPSMDRQSVLAVPDGSCLGYTKLPKWERVYTPFACDPGHLVPSPAPSAESAGALAI